MNPAPENPYQASSGEPGTAQPEHHYASSTPDEPQAVATEPSSMTPEEEAELRRIKDLPREVGVMLMTVGVLGFVLPGVIGTPAVIAGGLVLWPSRFARVETWFERRFPKIHKQSLHQINRFLDDLDHRFPPREGGGE